jgi:hypothetical protein
MWGEIHNWSIIPVSFVMIIAYLEGDCSHQNQMGANGYHYFSSLKKKASANENKLIHEKGMRLSCS